MKEREKEKKKVSPLSKKKNLLTRKIIFLITRRWHPLPEQQNSFFFGSNLGAHSFKFLLKEEEKR